MSTRQMPAAFVDADLGATYRQLDYWIRKGYLRPDGAGSGQGSKRTWPRSEAQIARLMARLTAAGMEPIAAASAARRLAPLLEHGQPVKLELVAGVYVEVQPEATS